MAKNYEPKEPGINKKVLNNALAAWKLPRVDVKDPQAIAERIDLYLKHCADHDTAPSSAGCASWLGIARSTLEGWLIGRTATPEHQKVAQRFYGLLEDIWAQNMTDGNINPVSGIFIGKSMFGYKDTQEIVINTKAQNELSVEDLIAESKMLPGGDNLIIDGEAKMLEDVPTETPQKEPVEVKKKVHRTNTEKN